ncbi:MAG: replication-relaxation family protein [Solirubrobacteraceae bacterium]
MLIRLFGTQQEEFFENERRWFRGSFLGPKDHVIMWGLFTMRVMSAVQITAELFPGQQVSKARTRLNRLREKGLVERVRGGRATGSEPYLWSLTQKGFRALVHEQGNPVSFGDHRYDPQAWLVPEGAKFQPWGWANLTWGSDLPAIQTR